MFALAHLRKSQHFTCCQGNRSFLTSFSKLVYLFLLLPLFSSLPLHIHTFPSPPSFSSITSWNPSSDHITFVYQSSTRHHGNLDAFQVAPADGRHNGGHGGCWGPYVFLSSSPTSMIIRTDITLIRMPPYRDGFPPGSDYRWTSSIWWRQVNHIFKSTHGL